MKKNHGYGRHVCIVVSVDLMDAMVSFGKTLIC